MNANLLRGYTDAIILSQLVNQDSYGYRIQKDVSDKTAGGLNLKEATLYTAFRRLEQAGLIVSYWGGEQQGARRRYYSITETGKAKLQEEQNQWMETRYILEKLLMDRAEQERSIVYE